jgi:tetratricopeptide (TPR) repeat protein
MKEAEEMYLRALRGKEDAWGVKHTSTLDTVNNLAVLYSDQGRMKEAEEMYLRALRGKEEAWGAKHTSTLDTVFNLGNLYYEQNMSAKAREMYTRAAEGYADVDGDHEADIRYLGKRLSLLGMDDITSSTSCAPEMVRKARKRDRLLGLVKKR